MTQSIKSTERPFLTLAEFAESVGISMTSAYELARKNELPVPVFRVGRQFRVSRAAMQAMLTATHKHEPKSDNAA